MSDKEKVFTSTGYKLLRHPHVLSRIKGVRHASPMSLQIAPTSRCNLKCCFCSNVNRERHEDLSATMIFHLLNGLIGKGLRTVEWTGGGDPTCYDFIGEVVKRANVLRLEQGFITNGISLINLGGNLKYLKWLRISMNCLDYMDEVDFYLEGFKGVLGFSYVINKKTTSTILGRLFDYTEKLKPKYVRVVPDCQTSQEEQERNNVVYSKMVAGWGEPFFYQAKVFEKPEECYWGYLKPFVLHDGWVYPCSSVVLNLNADRKFHENYRWVRAEELPLVYEKGMKPFPTNNCSHCVFTNQNRMVKYILDGNEMEDFI